MQVGKTRFTAKAFRDPMRYIGNMRLRESARARRRLRGDRLDNIVMFFRRVAHEAREADRLVDDKVDRKSVVQGMGVSVRVDLGGRRVFKNTKNTRTSTTTHSLQNTANTSQHF